jgi:FkbM family methyltransferase
MLFRFSRYFSYLWSFFGFLSACMFVWFYMLAKVRGSREGKPHYIPVGPYVFYFPRPDYFAGLFTEIFLHEGYYLPKSDARVNVIDCGANIGVSLLYIKLRVPRAKVLCFEPNPGARAMLEKNIRANGWQDEVTVYSCALGREKAQRTFFVDSKVDTDSSAGFSQMLQNRGHELKSFPVSVEPLSQYIQESVEYLKIDVEGSELDVLEDLAASGTIRQVKHIQLEYHYEPGFFERPLSDLLVLLEKNGFQTVAIPTAPLQSMLGHTSRRNYMVYAWPLAMV